MKQYSEQQLVYDMKLLPCRCKIRPQGDEVHVTQLNPGHWRAVHDRSWDKASPHAGTDKRTRPRVYHLSEYYDWTNMCDRRGTWEERLIAAAALAVEFEAAGIPLGWGRVSALKMDASERTSSWDPSVLAERAHV